MRDLLIKYLLLKYPAATFVLDFQNLMSRLQPGIWNQVVPIGATPSNAVNIIVDVAITNRWVHQLINELTGVAPVAELQLIRASFALAAATAADPFDEVLLEGERPFVNRRGLRAQLRLLCQPAGSTLLLIDGDRSTGKSFSFYLAQHIARQNGFITSQFLVEDYPELEKLAAEILERIGVSAPLRPQGTESAVRWAERLAAQVKDAIEERKLPRFFVFDEFPRDSKDKPTLPEETAKFILRLAKYADEELRPLLRVLLIEFKGSLPSALDDAAERDVAQPFTDADMLSVLQQVATARGWSVSEHALQTEIGQLGAAPPLRTRFKFLKETIRRLKRTTAAPVVPSPPGGSP